MSRRRDDGADAAAIARASRVVTAQITVAAAAIVVLVVALSVAFIKKQSEPSELLEKPAPGQTKIYVDANEMLVDLIVVGIIAIALAGLMSWVIARRAVRPLGEALRIQRTFVADASHELRTPVAVVAARVELLGQEIDAGADTAENLAGWVRDPAARRRYIEAFKQSDFEAMLNYYKRNYPAQSGAEAPAAPEMPKVQAPVLMFHGLRDTALHADGLSGTWNWVAKDLTIVTAPESGHFVQQDAADLVTTTMKWWLKKLT